MAYKALKANSPSLMDLQGRLHARYCSGEQNTFPGGFTNIHESHYFLLWHRGFVYFHERMLQKYASGDKPLALPYWDWSGSSMANLYGPSSVDNFGRPLACPPSHSPLPTGLDSLLEGLVKKRAMNAIRPNGYADFQFAFTAPHSNGHSMAKGLMPDLPVAAWDPLFYGHHGNCDRYFASWQLANPTINNIQYTSDLGSYGPIVDIATDKTWLYFYNEEGNLVKMLAKHLWDTKTLGYAYDSLEVPNEIHRLPIEGAPFVSQRPLDKATRRALKDGRAVWAELGDLDDSPASVGERIAFLLRSENDTLPKNTRELSDDPRVLGQISRLPHANHQKAQRSSSAVDATSALNHFVKSGAKKMWIATVEIDRYGNLQNRKAWPKKAKLRTAYFSVNRRTPR
ncbi:MAG: tyrosinase family protein [Acidobacteria bacterium]|nr:tyrosinase family protein [Acidobacteriota bacterium]